MPLIPTFKSQSVNVKQVNMPEASLAPVKASERSQGGMVNAIEQAEDSIVKVRDFRQRSEAGIFVAQRLADIRARASSDIDLDSSKYETEIDQVGAEAAKTISGQLAKEDFFYDFQRQALSAKTSIQQDFRVKELHAAEAALEYQGQNIIDTVGSMDEGTKFTMLASHKKSLQEAVTRGIYDQPTADMKWAKFQKGVVKGSVDYGILNNPESTLAELQKGDEGEFPGLDQTERAGFIKEAETRIEQLDNQKKEAIAIAMNQRESELIDGKMAGTLTVPNVKRERELGSISAEFADSMIRALERPQKAETRSATFNKISDFILNPENKPDDIKLELLKENAKGVLSDEDFGILYTFNQAVNNDVIDIALPKKSFMEAITFWSDEYAPQRPEVKARMFKSYMQKLAEGKGPAMAIDEVIKKEVLLNHPQAANYPKEGKKVIDIFGVIKRILPTGEIEDEE